MSEHKTKRPSVTVVETPTRWSRARGVMPNRHGRLFIIILAVVMTLGATGLIAARASRTNEQSTQRQSGTKSKKLSDADYEQARSGIAATDPKAALKLAQDQADDSLERQMMLAAAYADNKQYDQALSVYDKAQTQGTITSEFLSGAAYIALAAGQKPRAAQYLQAAIAKGKGEADKGPTYQADMADYEKRLAELRK